MTARLHSLAAERQRLRQRRTAYPPADDCIARAAETQRQMIEGLADSLPCDTSPSSKPER